MFIFAAFGSITIFGWSLFAANFRCSSLGWRQRQFVSFDGQMRTRTAEDRMMKTTWPIAGLPPNRLLSLAAANAEDS